MKAKWTYKITPQEFYGMRPEERDKHRQYRQEVERRRFANFLLGDIQFQPAGAEDTYVMKVIITSEDRYLNFKMKVRNELENSGIPYQKFEAILNLFQKFEVNDEDNNSTVQGSTAAP